MYKTSSFYVFQANNINPYTHDIIIALALLLTKPALTLSVHTPSLTINPTLSPAPAAGPLGSMV